MVCTGTWNEAPPQPITAPSTEIEQLAHGRRPHLRSAMPCSPWSELPAKMILKPPTSRRRSSNHQGLRGPKETVRSMAASGLCCASPARGGIGDKCTLHDLALDTICEGFAGLGNEGDDLALRPAFIRLKKDVQNAR